DQAQKLEAVYARHHHIADHQVWFQVAYQLKSTFRAKLGLGLVPSRMQMLQGNSQCHGTVVNDQNSEFLQFHTSGTCENSIKTRTCMKFPLYAHTACSSFL